MPARPHMLRESGNLPVAPYDHAESDGIAATRKQAHAHLEIIGALDPSAEHPSDVETVGAHAADLNAAKSRSKPTI